MHPDQGAMVITSVAVRCPGLAFVTASSPRVVFTSLGFTGDPFSVAEATFAPSGSTAPMVASIRPCRVTLVVYVEPECSAATSICDAPNLIFVGRRLGLPGRELRHDGDPAATEFGRDAEPLVDDRPEHAVRAPGLHHHRSLGEQPVDVGAEVTDRARSPAWRRASPTASGRAGSWHCPRRRRPAARRRAARSCLRSPRRWRC